MSPAPGMPADDTLLVPIDLQALAVGPSTPRQSVPSETVIPNPASSSPEAATLPQPPPLFAPPSSRAGGVYLHWAMPDALTRGDAGSVHDNAVPAGNPSNMPALPDRWLVVRMIYGTNAAQTFVLMAD